MVKLVFAIWAFVLSGAMMLEAASPAPYGASAVSNHLAALKQRAGRAFTVAWEPPFAIAGDGEPTNVRFVATNTVRWATVKLKAAYFANDPRQIVDIWLFKDDPSYRHHARKLFGDSPETPFGYYSPKHRALIMNISTGTGTLVHEMVHAFMPANFEECPAWFNEGLASLYEQCGERSGGIHGFPNWRLPGLQKAIRDQKLPTFQQLTSTTTDQFYGRNSAAGYSEQYAQARYLCYYLQQRGMLGKFYREFRDNVATDPTGYASLQKVLGEPDMELFQKKWATEILLLTNAR
jgi:hypothetical protein